MCRYTCSLLSFFPRLSSLLSFPPDGSHPFSHPREEEEKEEDEEEEDEKEESFRKTINRILWSQLRNIAENSTYFSLKSSLRLVLPHFSSRRKKREEWENRESSRNKIHNISQYFTEKRRRHAKHLSWIVKAGCLLKTGTQYRLRNDINSRLTLSKSWARKREKIF